MKKNNNSMVVAQGAKPLILFSRTPFKSERKGWVVRRTTLPKKFIEKVESHTDDFKVANRLIHLLSAVYGLFLTRGLKKPTTISREYVIKVLNGNTDYYSLFSLTIVKDWELIAPQKNRYGVFYSWIRGEAKKYKLNPLYLTPLDLETIYYEVRLLSPDKGEDKWQSLSDLERNVFDNIASVSLNDNLNETLDKFKDVRPIINQDTEKRTFLEEGSRICYRTNKGIIKYPVREYKSVEQFVKYKSQERFQSCLDTIHNIDSLVPDMCFPHRDDKTQRLYHLMTNCNTQVLPFLHLNGEEIWEIDMKNCQFTLLANAIAGATRRGVVHIPSIVDNIFHFINYGYKLELPLRSPLGPWGDPYKSNSYLCSDFLILDRGLKEALNACYKGNLYELIGSRVLDKARISQDEREHIKTQCFVYLYGNMDYALSSEDKVKFNVAFRSFHEIISRVKWHLSILLRNKDERLEKLGIDFKALKDSETSPSYLKVGSSLLSILLSRMESSLFIDRILTRLHKMNLSVITKHDCYLVAGSDREDASMEIERCFNDFLGSKRYSLSSKCHSMRLLKRRISKN